MPKTNLPKAAQRFTADEIVRTIEAVTKAGLTVHSVEITHSGSIKIETQPHPQTRNQRSSTTAANTANEQGDLKKKQA